MAEDTIVTIVHKEDGENGEVKEHKDADLNINVDAIEVKHEKTYVSLTEAVIEDNIGIADIVVYPDIENSKRLVFETEDGTSAVLDAETLLAVLLKAVQL